MTLLGVWLAGSLLRRIAVNAGNELVSQVAAMTLFAPMSVAVVWIGWRTHRSWSEVGLLSLVMSASFAVWNGIMLYGLPIATMPDAIQSNSTHWIAYLLAGCFSMRLIQWIFGIGIWHIEQGEGGRRDCEPHAKPLSIAKMLMILALVAVLLSVYRNWLPSDARDLSNTKIPFPQTAFQFFPSYSKPTVSAVVGGLTLALHWTAIASIIKCRGFRFVGLVVWYLCMIAIRWGSNQIYWTSSDALIDLNSSPTPILLANLIRQISNPPTWTQYSVEALVQLGLTLTAYAWLGWIDFRIGFKNVKKMN